MAKYVLTEEMVRWAHKQYIEEGYNTHQLAQALFCNDRTITKAFRRYGLKLKHDLPPLKYPGSFK